MFQSKQTCTTYLKIPDKDTKITQQKFIIFCNMCLGEKCTNKENSIVQQKNESNL
jgi:hypothetical protein